MTSSISLEWAVGSESEGIMVVGRRKERLGIDKMLLYIVKGVWTVGHNKDKGVNKRKTRRDAIMSSDSSKTRFTISYTHCPYFHAFQPSFASQDATRPSSNDGFIQDTTHYCKGIPHNKLKDINLHAFTSRYILIFSIGLPYRTTDSPKHCGRHFSKLNEIWVATHYLKRYCIQ